MLLNLSTGRISAFFHEGLSRCRRACILCWLKKFIYFQSIALDTVLSSFAKAHIHISIFSYITMVIF